MVSFISSWAQQIIFAVIIGTIIQIILPEGKSKKYIKVVIGIYVLFTVISPVVGKDIDLNLEQYNINLESKTNTIEANTKNDINNIYITNLKQDIVAKLQNKGYDCENVELKTSEEYDVEEIKIIGIYETKDDENDEDEEENNADENKKINEVIINEVQIGTKENSIKDQVTKGIPKSEETKLKEYLSETYDVKEKNIKIE